MLIKHPFGMLSPIHFEDKAPTTDAEIEAQVEKDLKATEETKVEAKEPKEEETKEIDTTEEDKARQLYEALKNPETATILIKAMAEGIGLKITDVETKEEKKEAVKSIKDAVKEELGPDYSFLADKLGTVFEKILTTQIESRTKALEDRLNKEAEEKSKEKLETALDTAFSRYANVSDAIKNAVYGLVDEMPPTKGTDPIKYWDRLIHTAARENKVSLVEKNKSVSTETRRERNRNDAQNRVRSEDTADEKFSDAGSNVND